MTPATAAAFSLAVAVPPDPSFVGATVYCQAAVVLLPALGALNARLSNGLSVSL